jgi:hypothetical protein
MPTLICIHGDCENSADLSEADFGTYTDGNGVAFCYEHSNRILREQPRAMDGSGLIKALPTNVKWRVAIEFDDVYGEEADVWRVEQTVACPEPVIAIKGALAMLRVPDGWQDHVVSITCHLKD